jgi:serine/threonine protein kinase
MGQTGVIQLANYRVGDVVHAGDHSLVVRAQRLTDGRAVVLKTSAAPQPSSAAVQRLQAEYAMGSRVRHAGIIEIIGLVQHEHRPVLVMHDGGSALDRLVEPLAIPTFLDVACSLADAVAALHDAGIAHRDINPTNVLRDGLGRVRLCDLGRASVLTQQDLTVTDATHLEGSLRYISPEQTGRMNRAVDYRTDFYSLGAVFYELLSGRPPLPPPTQWSWCIAISPAIRNRLQRSCRPAASG